MNKFESESRKRQNLQSEQLKFLEFVLNIAIYIKILLKHYAPA